MTISGFFAYVKQAWHNRPNTSTPISAERLTHVENGIKGNSDAIAKIAAAVVSQIVNDQNKIASMAALHSVNQKVTQLNSDMVVKYLPTTFNDGFTSDGNRCPITISGNTVVMRLSIFANNGFKSSAVAATIESKYAPPENIVLGCFLGDGIYDVQEVGYLYINTSGAIQVVDRTDMTYHYARAIVAYQINPK